MRRSLFALVIAAATLAAPASPFAPATLAAQDLGIAVGSTAPGAPIETLDGKAADLSAYLGGGTPTLLEFWATWCPNCKALEPQFATLKKTYGDGLRLVAVAVSLNQSRERVRAYAARGGSPFTFVYDPKGLASQAYDAPATSYVVLVDGTGKVVYTGVGKDQELLAAVRGVMGR